MTDFVVVLVLFSAISAPLNNKHKFCQLLNVSSTPFSEGSFSSRPCSVRLDGSPAASTRAMTVFRASRSGSSTLKCRRPRASWGGGNRCGQRTNKQHGRYALENRALTEVVGGPTEQENHPEHGQHHVTVLHGFSPGRRATCYRTCSIFYAFEETTNGQRRLSRTDRGTVG